MSLLQHGAAIPVGNTGYDIDNSVKMQTAGVNSEFFNYNISSAGSRTTGTVSMWIKRSTLGVLQYLWEQGNQDNDNGRLFVRFGTDDTLRLGGGSTVFLNTNRVFRDTSAWYHIVVAVDTTSGTANNRMRIYVNGVEETSFSTRNNTSQNDTTGLNWQRHWVGLSVADESAFQSFSGYMAEVVFQDGVASAPTEFGEFDSTSGIWIPKDASDVTMGTNGSYMKFENAASMGAATAGHGFSVQNINQNDQSTDTPTNNFCTYNNNWRTASTIAATEGQTKVEAASGAGWVSIVATFGLTSGKWYWEAASSANYVFYGIADVESDTIPQKTGGYFLGYGDDNSTKAIGMYGVNGQVYSDTAGHNGPGAAANTVVQIALDMDNRCVYFGANGSYISGADPTSGASKTNASQWNANWSDTVYPALSIFAGYHTTANFGGYTTDVISSAATDANGYGTFEYAPPSGYYAICTKNLAEYGG